MFLVGTVINLGVLMLRTSLWRAPAIFIAYLLCPISAWAQVTLVPYGSSGYRYAITSNSFPPVGNSIVSYGFSGYRYAITSGGFPPNVELPGFDDAGYAVGGAPFSSGTGSGIYSSATVWPVNTNLIARMHFSLPGVPSRTTLRFGIDNDVSIFINGVLVASVTHEGGANYDDFAVTLPDGVLHAGDNLLVALAVDRGGDTAFDVSLTTGVELPSFDDSGYAIGSAPFSSGAGSGIYSAATIWPANKKLIARLHFNAPVMTTQTSLRFGVDNDVSIFLNGVPVASANHDGPANYDDRVVRIPDGIIQPGDNLLVALAVDRGGDTAFDVSLTAEATTPTIRATWGALKAMFR